MPFEPQPGEVVLFPAPFIPNEPQELVISTKRVVQYAPEGMYPLAEIPLEKIEHVGRMSERPNMVSGILAAIVGLVFVIVFVAKVLPQAMYAGTPSKPDTPAADNGDNSDDGIEGRDSNDDDPFDDGKEHKENTRDKANKKLKKLKEVSFGWPGFTEDVVVGFLFLVGGLGALFLGFVLYRKERHTVFCRVGEIVYPIEVRDSIQQNAVLAMIQGAQQALPKK
jgi:hypothetical protein